MKSPDRYSLEELLEEFPSALSSDQKRGQRASSYGPDPTPQPLRREPAESKPFPVDALGEILGPAASGIQDITNAPMALCGQAVMAAATLAAQGHADVVLPGQLPHPICNFFVTVASTGERKTTVDKIALKPIRKREAELAEKYEEELLKFQYAKDAYEAEKKRISNDKKSYADLKAREQALEKLGRPPQTPLKPYILCNEPTIEGITKHFGIGQPSMGIFSSEGGQLIGGHGMTKEHRLKTVSGLSLFWDNEPMTRVRVADDVTSIIGRRLSMHLQVQPAVAELLLSDQFLFDQGFQSRLLVVQPDSAMGTRIWSEPDPGSQLAIDKFYDRLLLLLRMEHSTASPTRPNELRPKGLKLSDKAKDTWINFSNKIERRLGDGGDLEPIRGFANKLAEHAARLGAVVALIENPNCRKLLRRHIRAGINLARYYASEALRQAETGATDPNILMAEKLLAWLRSDWDQALVSVPDICRLGPRNTRKKATASMIVNILVDHGWLVQLNGPHVINGENRKVVYRIIKD